MIDLFLLYSFIKRLSSPFDKWKAYSTGVIDKDGNILVSPNDRTKEQKDSFGRFDLLILKLKRLLEKIPGGKSKIGTYSAALWLIKEHNMSYKETELIDEATIEKELVENMATISEEMDINSLFEDYINEDAPINNAGGGAIAGIGVGPDGEPGMGRRIVNKYKKKNEKDTKKLEANTHVSDL